MKIYFKLFLIILFMISLLFPKHVMAVEQVVFNDNVNSISLGHYLEIFEDKTGKLNIYDVQKPEIEKLFYHSKWDVSNFGFTKSTYWIKFSINNKSENTNDLFIEHRYPPIDKITLFYKNNNELIIKQSGDSILSEKKEIKNRNAIFKIEQKAKSIQTYYIQFVTTSSMNLDMVVWKPIPFIEHTDFEQGFLGLYYGIIIVMILYNFFIFISLKDISYIFYVLYLLFYLLFQASLNGLGYKIIPNIFLLRFNNSMPLILFFSLIFSLLFARSFLNTKNNFANINKYFNFLLVVNIIGIPFSFVFPYYYNIQFVTIMGAITSFSLLICGIIILKHGYRPARYYVIAWMFFCSAVPLQAAKAFSFLPVTFFIVWSQQIFSALESILLSLALADRINNLKQEKEFAQSEALRFQKDATESLENKVEERTHELADANVKLQELDKLKSNFFANISHEIRTPLTLILSPVESVLQGDYGENIDKMFFENLHRNAIRLLKLINNLLDFSKIEAGRMNLKIQEIDAVLYLKNYISSVHSAAESKEISLNFSSLSNETVLFVDIEKFDKIIMNLFSNALKFTDKGGSIKIVFKDDEKNCFIEFTDTGVGIPSDKLESIFDRFSQADTGSTRKYEGTGIGLALAKEFVELHDGFIIAKSKYIEDSKSDHGTTFTVTIPKGKEHFQNKENIQFVENNKVEESILDYRFSGMSEITELKNETEIVEFKSVLNRSQITILVVEDNPDMRSFLNFLLKDLYNVHLAVNGEEGLKFAHKIKPDLIVSDVMMPIMNGYEMTKKIKEDDEIKRIPVILLTARAEISNKIEGLEYGADDYLTKPFNSKELLTRIKTHLKTYKYEKIIVERNQVMEDELETARLLQQKLLPDMIPEISGYNSHVTYIPMDKVGGDFYDYKENGNIIELFIADVSGHGLPGAFLSMIAKMTLESITTRISTTSVLYLINDVICKSTVKNNYITTFYCMIDKHTNIMRYCNAGHFPPLIYRKKSDEFIDLNTRGTALGWFKSIKLEEKEIQLKPGDRLLLYTDGITECMDTNQVEFGDERFKNYIKSNIDLSPEKFTQNLLYNLRELTGSESFDDDLCLIVFDVM